MMRPSTKINELCESWWSRLADNARAEQHRHGEELLRLLGWDQPVPFSAREAAAAYAAQPFVLRASGQTTVSAYFVQPGALEPPSAIIERGLDYCRATRLLVDEARSLNVDYVLVCDYYRSYFYDARHDELLLSADDPKGFNAVLLPVLQRQEMERGALEEIRRAPRSAAARSLREWIERWTREVTFRGRVAEDAALSLLDRLLVLRYLFRRDIFRRTRKRLQQRFEELTDRVFEQSERGCGYELVQLFHDMWFDWRIGLFEGNPELDRVVEDDAIAGGLLKELSLQAEGKFSIATILESFNHGDPAEKLRVRMVPDVNDERDQYLAKQSLASVDEARIEIDLMEEGYRAIFHWFDKVVSLYERLEIDFDSATYKTRPAQREFDLLSWSEVNSQRPRACGEKLAHACEHGFGVYYASPRQYRVARLMLTLHLIDRYEQGQQSVERFPRLERVLMPRPRVLSADRVMKGAPDHNAYGDAVEA